MTEKHAMIDLETLGLGVEAPIFEIGVTVFDLDELKIIDSRNIHLDLLDVIFKTGFLPQKDTVEWWRGQAYDPTMNKTRLSLNRGLNKLDEYLSQHEVKMVWGNSPAFDCVLLEQHYKAIGRTNPWKYNEELDFRSLKWVHRDYLGREMPEVANEVVSHNAERDSQRQTECLFAFLRALKSVPNG